ncbi:serine/threonine protein phosphatase 1 [Bradyrhizobium sp. S3.2.6]|uniref:metallophosphoesterase family protein n=1 Tax=Bradyrhizobium sp. S3.2.6 TaxID=3156428 RepID=UPI003390E22F
MRISLRRVRLAIVFTPRIQTRLEEIYLLWNIPKKYSAGIKRHFLAKCSAAPEIGVLDDIITFAIGDVHGCFDKLVRLLEACDMIKGGRHARFVFIGDYVDRGPDARKVLDVLIDRQERGTDHVVCLRGNHDDMLLRAAARERTDADLVNWWANGGEQTLDSYGVGDPCELPKEHLAWIDALPLTFTDRGRLFVHAGIRPGVPVPDQTEDDVLWIREPFLSSRASHGAFVVHGHTPTESGLPDLRPNRLNIDTGACFGRALTAASFTADRLLPTHFIDSDGDAWPAR